MQFRLNIPIEKSVTAQWARLDKATRKAFLAACLVSLFAFGFEMTNLTLHHDDVNHFFAGPLVGYYLGRFGYAWLNYYGQGGYYMPFLQLSLGIAVMGLYGVIVARFWGLRKALDIALIATLVSVFPYMAHIYQYNTAVVPFSVAHLLAAGGVILSTRARFLHVALAAVLYVAAFSIYQAVLSNAATIFVIWLLASLLFREQWEARELKATLRSTIAAAVSVLAGGVIYVLIVAWLDIPFDSAQGADKAFSLSYRLENGFQLLLLAASDLLRGTKSFFLWPQNYFPDPLKTLQLFLMVGALILCFWLPGRIWMKIVAPALLVLASFAPRTMQLLHPQGNFHSLTLTAYALVVAGALMIILQSNRTLARNLSTIVAALLIAGYVAQCNWISTVNHLNTLAHYATLTQILSRIRSLPDKAWDGSNIAVVGSYDMRSDYPFKPATGVATEFIDIGHMRNLARLMREDVNFLKAGTDTPGILEYAGSHSPWPHPTSVGVVNGMGVVVLSVDNSVSHK